MAVAARRDLRAGVSRDELDDEIKRGLLVRVAPHAYARPWDADTPDVLELAALKSTGGTCALSHTTALHRWDLPAPADGPIHITAATDQRPRQRAGVCIHRTHLPIESVVRRGAPTVRPAWAVVGSWPLLLGAAQRAPLIDAIARRLVTIGEVRVVVAAQTRLRGRAALLGLLDLVESGCHSELELWGYLHVFDTPALRGAIRQRTVVVGRRIYRLDMAYELEQVAVSSSTDALTTRQRIAGNATSPAILHLPRSDGRQSASRTGV
jgi:hypothetical protein